MTSTKMQLQAGGHGLIISYLIGLLTPYQLIRYWLKLMNQ